MKAKHLVYLTTLFVSHLLLVGCQSSQPVAEPLRVSQTTSSAITIDGKLDEDAWQQAPASDSIYHIRRTDTYDPLPPQLEPGKLKLRLMVDNENLYIAGIISDADIIADPELKDQLMPGHFLTGDVFEVFIQPDAEKPLYFELHASPYNAQWDARFAAMGYMGFVDHASWDSGMETAVTVDGTINTIDQDRSWTVEMRLPAKAIFGDAFKPSDVDKARISISLYDYSVYYDNNDNVGTRRFYSTSPHPVISFHRRGDFRRLQLDKP